MSNPFDESLTSQWPLVTIMIATRDRPTDLRETITRLKTLDYPNLELVIIDDGSQVPIAPLVLEIWPSANVVRHERPRGQCARRNEGFKLALGQYILHLDDDCSLVGSESLRKAITKMQVHVRAAALVPYMYNGCILPEEMKPRAKPGCVPSFVGACVLLRTEVVRSTTGYADFFLNEGEEEDLALQFIQKGYYLLFDPSLIAHHRLSPINRRKARTWRRGLRNRIWTILMRMPARVIFPEIAWKLLVGMWDSVRLVRPLHFVGAVLEGLAGMLRALLRRDPMTMLAYRRYCALRLHGVLTVEQFENPKAIAISDISSWLQAWRARARDSDAWDSDRSDKGASVIVGYAHEYQINKNASKNM